MTTKAETPNSATKAPPPAAPLAEQKAVPHTGKGSTAHGGKPSGGKGAPENAWVGVEEYAAICEAALDADNPSMLIAPGGCKLTQGKSKKGEKQLFLHMDAAMAWRNKRVHGYIGAIQKLLDSSNTATPLLIQLIIRVPFTTKADKVSRNLFMRINAFSAHYMPLSAEDTNIFLGDTLTGVIEAPKSERHQSACLVAWRHAEANFEMRLEFQQLGGGVAPGSVKLNPDMLFMLPILAADNFGASPNPMFCEKGG